MNRRSHDHPSARSAMQIRPFTHPLPPVLLLAIALGACGGGDEPETPAPIAPLPDSALAPAPIRGLPDLPDSAALAPRSFTGPTELHLTSGDAYVPALSPSGDRIAWGELVDGEVPVTRILVRPVEGGGPGRAPAGDTGSAATPSGPSEDTVSAGPPPVPVDTVLRTERSRRYAAYGTFLQEMAWEGEDRLRAILSDGDVGRIDLLLSLPSGEIVSESSGQGEPGVRLPAEDRRLLERLEAAFPDIPRRVLESSFGGLLIRRAEGGVLLQKNYVGTDRHVWYLDPERDVRERVVELPDSLLGNLRGGVGVGRTTAFLLAFEGAGHLAIHRPGRARIVDSFRLDDGGGRLREVARSDGRALFVVRTGSGARPGTDRLYLLSEGGISRVTAPGGLAGVGVSGEWSRIAFSYWSGGDRDLRVAPLRVP